MKLSKLLYLGLVAVSTEVSNPEKSPQPTGNGWMPVKIAGGVLGALGAGLAVAWGVGAFKGKNARTTGPQKIGQPVQDDTLTSEEEAKAKKQRTDEDQPGNNQHTHSTSGSEELLKTKEAKTKKQSTDGDQPGNNNRGLVLTEAQRKAMNAELATKTDPELREIHLTLVADLVNKDEEYSMVLESVKERSLKMSREALLSLIAVSQEMHAYRQTLTAMNNDDLKKQVQKIVKQKETEEEINIESANSQKMINFLLYEHFEILKTFYPAAFKEEEEIETQHHVKPLAEWNREELLAELESRIKEQAETYADKMVDEAKSRIHGETEGKTELSKQDIIQIRSEAIEVMKKEISPQLASYKKANNKRLIEQVTELWQQEAESQQKSSLHEEQECDFVGDKWGGHGKDAQHFGTLAQEHGYWEEMPAQEMEHSSGAISKESVINRKIPILKSAGSGSCRMPKGDHLLHGPQGLEEVHHGGQCDTYHKCKEQSEMHNASIAHGSGTCTMSAEGISRGVGKSESMQKATMSAGGDSVPIPRAMSQASLQRLKGSGLNAGLPSESSTSTTRGSSHFPRTQH